MNIVPAVYVNVITWKFNSNWVCFLNWKLLGYEHSYISVRIGVRLELHERSIKMMPVSGSVLVASTELRAQADWWWMSGALS